MDQNPAATSEGLATPGTQHTTEKLTELRSSTDSVIWMIDPYGERILTMRHTQAAVALDTIGPIAARIRTMISHGRRIAIATRYLSGNHATELAAGLTVSGVPETWETRDGGKGFAVRLQPVRRHDFGISADPTDSATEEQVWARYRAADTWNGKRDMTVVWITGGMPGDAPHADDRLIIHKWNSEGVGRETVVAFDNTTGPIAEQLQLANRPFEPGTNR